MAKLSDELKQQQQLIDDLKQRMLDLRRAKENATNPADVAALSKQLRATSLDLGDAGQKFNNLSKAQAAAAEWAKKLEQAERGVALGFGLATGAMGGFVRAGLQGTTLGERLAFTQKQLAMQFASVFVPWIEKGVTALQHLTERFRGLTGEQQQQIARWTALGVSLMGSLVIVPRLTAALKGLGGSLGLSIAANPMVAVTAGIVGLLSMTDKGREALGELGAALMQAFEPLAEVINELIVPGIQALADLLGTTAGKWVAFGAIFIMTSVKIIGAIRAMTLAMGGLATAMTFGLALVAMSLAGKSGGGFGTSIRDITDALRKGTIDKNEAEKKALERVEADFDERRSEIEHGEGRGFGGFLRRITNLGIPDEEIGNMTRAEMLERNEELRRKAREKAMHDIAGTKGGERSDLTLARTGTEDARATIRRLEDAVLKVDSGKETAKNTGDMAKTMTELAKMIADINRRIFGKQDNRPNWPQDD